MNTPRMTDWHIETRKTANTSTYVCCRSADWEHPRVIGCFDTQEYANKNDAVLRCRELNSQLVSGWMPDGHPQSW